MRKKTFTENVITVNDKLFKAIPGYNGYYASADGEIYSAKRCKLLCQQTKTIFDYKVVLLTVNKKPSNVMVHKLVALAWCPLPINGNWSFNDVLGNYMSRNLVVDHINRNKLDNSSNNLRWVSAAENSANAEPYGAPKGNKNAVGRKKSATHERYLYIYNNRIYTINELTDKLDCSKSKITESFRKNLNIVKSGTLSRVVVTGLNKMEQKEIIDKYNKGE